MFIDEKQFKILKKKLKNEFQGITIFNGDECIYLHYGPENYNIGTRDDGKVMITNGEWSSCIDSNKTDGHFLEDLTTLILYYIKKSSAYHKMTKLESMIENLTNLNIKMNERMNLMEENIKTMEEMLGYAPELYLSEATKSFQEKIQQQNS